MKKLLIMGICCTLAVTSLAQKETYDLVTYTPPNGWKKDVKENTYTSYIMTNNKKNTWCQVHIMLSVPSKGSLQQDFESEWQSLVVSPYHVKEPPRLTEPTMENGWQVKGGTAPFMFNNNNAIVMMTTMSGYNKAASIVTLTNSPDYNKEIQSFLESVEMKKPTAMQPSQNKVPANPSGKGKFSFTTTHFDDGWTSTVQEDWVEVTKSNIRVLVHYPNKKADAYQSVVLEGLKNAWDILVAPRYSNAANFEFKPITGWQTIEFAEADMVENTTGKTVHVVLFKMNYSNGTGKYVEFITTSKNAFEQEFGPYHQTTSGWEKMEKMANYNKFAVAASDLTGKWTSNFGGAIQYVNAATGFDAGMDTHASVENFTIGAGGSYSWDLGVASGLVGNIKFQSRKSSGKLTMTGNWKAGFSDIEGRPRAYQVYFSCIKGLRILWLDDKAFAKSE
jgi:hypothetical protein